ncbi:MAG TPA: DsbA family protein [Bryobacteraceae bacterium]|nr:DsbA family protein [Bryobacteraceae bacterium]
MRFLTVAAALCLSAGAALFSQTPAPAPKSALDKPTLEAYIRHLLLWNPQIQVAISDPKPAPMPGYQEFTVTGSYGQASLDEVFYVSADGSRIVRGAVYDINASPFQTELSRLTTDLHPSMGTPGAPVVIVLFSDYQCGYCRQEAQQLRANLLKTFPTQVRLYFKDLPIDAIHPWARNASIAGRCVFRQDALKFWDYHDWIFDKQAEVTPDNLKPKITEWATANSLDLVQFARCYDQRETEAEINASIAEARSLRVDSTPTLFVNGRKVPGTVSFAQLKAIIEFEIGHAQTTGQGGEKCCEVTLPTPLGK